MSRILLLFLLKYLLVVTCHESKESCDRDRSKLPRSFSSEESSHPVIEGVPSTSLNYECVKKQWMKPDYIHELVFVVRQRNISELTSFLREVSDPSSPKYGQHLSRGDVDNMTANPYSEGVLRFFFQTYGVRTASRSLNGEYVRGKASIAVWEKMLQTKFYTYQYAQDPVNIHLCGGTVRIESFRIPTELEVHVDGIVNAVEIPRKSCNGIPHGPKSLGSTSITDTISHDEVYMATETNTDAIRYGRDSFSSERIRDDSSRLEDVKGDQNNMFLSQPFHDESAPHAAINKQKSRTIAILDQQTRYWGVETQLIDWLLEMAETDSYAPVIGLGFSTQESSVYKTEIDAFNTLAIKLGCMGVTIVASSASLQHSSDLGESSWGYRNGPVFPSSSPYVTSVNRLATISKTSEDSAMRTLDRNTRNVHVSSYHPMPYWQTAVSASPLSSRTQLRTAPPPDDRYTERRGAGRAYPDFSLSIKSDETVSSERSEKMRAEETCLAAMTIFSNINSARKEAGSGPLGWVNPILYAYSDQLFDGPSLDSGISLSDVELDSYIPDSVLGVGDEDCMQSMLTSVTERKKKDGEGCNCKEKKSRRDNKDGKGGGGGKDDSKGEDKKGGDGGKDDGNGDDKRGVGGGKDGSGDDEKGGGGGKDDNDGDDEKGGKDDNDGDDKKGGKDDNDGDDENGHRPDRNATMPCPTGESCNGKRYVLQSQVPSVAPTVEPPYKSIIFLPISLSTRKPTVLPSVAPTCKHSAISSVTPTCTPSVISTVTPSDKASVLPTITPSVVASSSTVTPSHTASISPTMTPSHEASVFPTGTQTFPGTLQPDTQTDTPTYAPTVIPTRGNSKRPRRQPSTAPSEMAPKFTDSALIVQTFSSLHGLTDGNHTFISSLKAAITATVEIPVVIVMLSVPTPHRRMLLVELVTSYRVGTTAPLVPNDFVAMLHVSLNSDAFLKLMQNDTGMTDLAVTGLKISDATPTASPTSSPIRFKVDTVTILLAVAGAIIGAATIGIATCVTIYCCHRSMKHTEPVGPSLEMYALPMGDVVPMGSNPTSTRSMSSYPLAVLSAPTIDVVQNAYVLQDAERSYSTLTLFPSNLS